MGSRAVERLLALVALLVGGIYLLQALKLPLGTAGRPGPAFYPVAVAVFMCLVGLVATGKAFVAAERPRDTVIAPDPAGRGRVVAAVIVLTVFCLLLPWIGYPLAAFGFVTVLLLRLGSRWWAALAVGVVSAAASHYLFAILLGVPLPMGPW